MKKIILVSIAVVAIAAIAAFNVNLNNSQSKNLSAMTMANVEALAQGEGTASGGWIRTDSDCVYTITGAAGANVTIFGVTIIIGANGTATYTYGGGKTDCASGGNQQCTQRYCPSLS